MYLKHFHSRPTKYILPIIVYNDDMYIFTLDPKYKYNGGPWTEFGFGPYRYCSRYYSSLFSCSSYPSYYRTSLSYCNPIRDTIMLNCSTNNGNTKFDWLLSYR